MAYGVITKDSAAGSVNSLILNNVSYSWHSGDYPTAPSGYWGDNMAGNYGSKDWSGFPPGNIPSGNISCASLVSAIVSFINTHCTRIRQVNVIRRYTGDSSAVITQYSGYALMNNNFRQSLSDVSPSALGLYPSRVIKDSDFSNACRTLLSRWQSCRANVAQTVTFYTHTSHSSHGSRVRR